MTDQIKRISKEAAIDIWKSQCAAFVKSFRNNCYRMGVPDLLDTLEELHGRLAPREEDPLGFFLSDSLGQRLPESKKVKSIRARKRRELLALPVDERLPKHLFNVVLVVDDVFAGAKLDELHKAKVLKLLVKRKHKGAGECQDFCVWGAVRKRSADDLRRFIASKRVLAIVI